VILPKLPRGARYGEGDFGTTGRQSGGHEKKLVKEKVGNLEGVDEKE